MQNHTEPILHGNLRYEYIREDFFRGEKDNVY